MIMVLFGLSAIQLSAQVSGTVFMDLPLNGSSTNTYGVMDGSEAGLGGVTVNVYEADGTLTTVTTITDGTWSAAPATFPVRVEFDWMTPYPTLESSPNGAGSATDVQFVAAAAGGVDFGLHAPTCFVDGSAILTTPYQRVGSGAGGSAGLDAFVTYARQADGSGTNTVIANHSQIGPTYGVAFQKNSKTLMTGAIVKRHSELASTTGSVFRIDDPDGTPSVSEYFSLDALGFSTGPFAAARMIPDDPSSSSQDDEAFAKAGVSGLGDIDLDATEENLFVVNLFDKKLYKINISLPAKAVIAAGDISSFTIPDPSCTNGVWRPYALGLDAVNNIMYVGGFCDASTGATIDLHAYVYAFNLTTNTFNAVPVLDFPLDFTRQEVHLGAGVCENWNPWTDDFDDFTQYEGHRFCDPQPILSDIALTGDGSLVLGFKDRSGDQLGHNNLAPSGHSFTINNEGLNLIEVQSNGDMYFAKKIAGVAGWSFENNGNAGGVIGSGVGNNDGPGTPGNPSTGPFGEFFGQDNFANHSNTSVGGLSIACGSNEVEVTSMDPIDTFSGGNTTHSTTNGNETHEYEIFRSGNNGDTDFGKANGLGDLELISAPAPLEIGNLVWEDTDNDGIQDPDEPMLDGVTVTLHDIDNGGAMVGTATTAGGGQYYFGGAGDVNMTSGSLMPTRNYELRVTLASAQVANALLTTATSPNSGSNDLHDSDGVFASGTSVAAFSTSVIGANNHNYDFGFTLVPCPPTRCGTVGVVKN